MDGKIIVSIISVMANAVLAIGKIAAGIISGSAAIIADGVNSITDVAASAIGYIGIKAAEKPADKEHPYGHGKAEVISGFVITLIIFFSGLWIIYDAVNGLFIESDLNMSYLAFGVMASSALINGIMSWLKVHYGKKYDSITLISDGVHSRIDLLVSAVIFIGLFFADKYLYVDSLLALFVGAYILKESLELGKESVDLLMGRSADEETENRIKNVIKKEGIILKELKTQKKGSSITANIMISLPRDSSVEDATKVSESLRKKLMGEIGNLKYIAIQVESFDFSEGYYRPPAGFGEGIVWRGKGRMPHGRGKGPEGKCVCSKCGKMIPHERGKPCYEVSCPACGAKMTRG